MSDLPAIPENYQVMQMSKDELLEVIQENIGPGGISHLDLDRIRIPAGGATSWSIPDLEGERSEKVVRGIISYQTVSRGYWESSFDDGGGAPPTCYSPNGITGIGDPGGDCSICKFNQWGSDRRGGKGKACRELRLLFMLAPDSLLPFVVVLPPTSVKPAHQYLIRLASKGIPYYGIVTEISLEKEKSNTGIVYGKASFKAGERLNPEQAAKMKSYKAAISPSLMQVKLTQQDVEVEGESADVDF